ncbi:MAG: phosphoribosylaminoimidazolesuccinocarboxamide synthase [Gammaproteobacteria bacterium]|nr:MAG: phosphoribosylaminoimidazolesuccinocarboxamide synthase [Gammaproteobacteria bacterium]
MEALFESDISGLELLNRGKVRDVYAVDEERLLIVTTDRLSAFDVVLPDPIPSKGEVLNQISNFWFSRTAHIIENHLLDTRLSEVLPPGEDVEILARRSVVARRLSAIPIEAVARGYLIGSGWKDYRETGAVCGIALPDGMNLADRLPQAIFTPATKAESGEHDENISFERTAEIIGHDLAARVRDLTLQLYSEAADFARSRGIIIADTKFEFGVDDAGQLVLIDEVLTPDSSRFWSARSYRPGISPPSFDKQFVRDYLETLDWDKRPPGPSLPAEIIQRTSEKYLEALRLLTGEPSP